MPNFPPKLFSIGTSAVQVLVRHETRAQYAIVYPSTGKIAGNTGSIWVGIGFVPNAIAGDLGSGHMMQPGESFGELMNFPTDQVSKEAIYIVASVATQIVEVYEMTL